MEMKRPPARRRVWRHFRRSRIHNLRWQGGKAVSRPVALVTGGSRGIGRAIAVALAGAGYDVAVNYANNAGAAAAVVQEIEGPGARSVAVRGDVGDGGDRRAILDGVREAFGRLDLLVNNAGVAPLVREDILQAGEESFDRLIRINLKGPYFLTQQAARWMIEQKEADPERAPRIIFISSISAYTASVNRGDYCISKAGLSMATALWAERLAPYGIGVFEIRPGVIETDMTAAPPVRERYDRLFAQGMTPIARWGTPADVAKAVLAVATGLLPYSTGEVINVDGGFHLRRL
jgi:3-oxoacyl-[acyl-carrier protein] reductase